MRLLLSMVFALACATSAFAQCMPPPGLTIQQWYNICGQLVQGAYAQGLGQGMSYDAFVAGIYGRYVQAWSVPQQMPMPVGPQQCTLGQQQCFSGWARTCQQVGNGTMWITGAQRC